MSNAPKFRINDIVKYSSGNSAYVRIIKVMPDHGGKGSHYYYADQYFGGHYAFYESSNVEYVGSVDAKIFDLIIMELTRARKKFPDNKYQLAALGEEVGELNNALLEHAYGNAGPENVLAEAVQVAAMAIRVATEGDETFPYRYSVEKMYFKKG